MPEQSLNETVWFWSVVLSLKSGFVPLQTATHRVPSQYWRFLSGASNSVREIILALQGRGKAVYYTVPFLQARLRALVGVSPEEQQDMLWSTNWCRLLLHECGCNARTQSLVSPCCRPALTHAPVAMPSAPAQLAAGCHFWILLANHLGAVVALGPKQHIVCSCRGLSSWGSHAVLADVSTSCFRLCECMDV